MFALVDDNSFSVSQHKLVHYVNVYRVFSSHFVLVSLIYKSMSNKALISLIYEFSSKATMIAWHFLLTFSSLIPAS